MSLPHGGRGRRRRKPTDKEVFVLAFFLELQIHLKRWNLEPGAQTELSDAASRGRAPLRGALCSRRGCGDCQRQEDESASGVSSTQRVLTSRAAAPCPGAPARITLVCGPAALQEFRLSLLPGGSMISSLGRWASRGPLAHSLRAEPWIASLPKFQDFRAPGLA